MADPPREQLESSETLPSSDVEEGGGEALLTPAETGETLPATDTPGSRPAAPNKGTAPPSARSDDTGEREGQTLSERYTLLELLGRGGMSEVYVARHELLNKTVAVKVLRPEIAVTKASLNRFHQEARAAATIGSPHIIDITDYGFTEDGNAFIVMECLVGADLRVTLTKRGGPLPAGRAVGVIRQVLRGLAAAHARGIVHRDLKAENVFLCDREEGGEFVKLLDFGISKVTQPLDDSGEVGVVRTSTGAVMGTPQYIAPEQAHGDRDIDHRVDIYSTGVMLYEMLTGELPFSGRSALEVVMKHVQEAPQPPRERRPELNIPPELDAVVLKAMQKDREERFADAQAMLDALPAPAALPGGFDSATLSPAPREKRSYWGYGLVLIAVFALGTVGVLFVFAGGGQESSQLATPVLRPDTSAKEIDAGVSAMQRTPDAAPEGSEPKDAAIDPSAERADDPRAEGVAHGSDRDRARKVRKAHGRPASSSPGKGKRPADLHDNPYRRRGPAAANGGRRQP